MKICPLHSSLFPSLCPATSLLGGAGGKGKNLLLVSLYFVILLFICVGKSADGKTVVGFPNDGWVGSPPWKSLLRMAAAWDGAMYLHHPIFLWVQRVTPKRASVIGAPPGRTQAPLPPIGQISVLEKSRLALNLPHTRFVSYCRKHSADVHPHACRGHPPDPNAAFGRNFLAIVPKGQPKNGLPAALPKVYAPRGRFDNCVKPSSRPMTRCLFC